MTNDEVAKAWSKGQSAQTSKCGNTYRFSTDGNKIWSYGLMIGYTCSTHGKVVIDYTSRGNNFQSRTTSTHVSRAAKYGDILVNYKEVEGTSDQRAF